MDYRTKICLKTTLSIVIISAFCFAGLIGAVAYTCSKKNPPVEKEDSPAVQQYDYQYEIYQDETYQKNSVVRLIRYIGSDSEINIPTEIENKEVVSIGNSCFNGQEITSVTFSNTVTEIDDYAFYNCQELTEVNFGIKVQQIGVRAFAGCQKIETITFTAGIKEIGFGAFEGCKSLTSVVFNKTDYKIDSYAFSYTGIRTVSNLKFAKSIGNNAFSCCPYINVDMMKDLISYIAETGSDIFKNSGTEVWMEDVKQTKHSYEKKESEDDYNAEEIAVPKKRFFNWF